MVRSVHLVKNEVLSYQGVEVYYKEDGLRKKGVEKGFGLV